MARARANIARVTKRSASLAARPFKWVWDPRRRKKVLVSAAVAVALAAGAKYGPRAVEYFRKGKPPIIKPVPLSREELPRYKVSQLEAENLVEVIGGKNNGLIGEGVVDASKKHAFKLSVAKQWIDALDGKPDFSGDRLRGFAGLSAKTVVSLSETAMQFPGVRGGDISPREAAGIMVSAARLVEDCKAMRGGSIARGRRFYLDPEFVRRLARDSPDRKVVDFFKRLAEIDPAAIPDIYRELGL
jgi:hypothetical protein